MTGHLIYPERLRIVTLPTNWMPLSQYYQYLTPLQAPSQQADRSQSHLPTPPAHHSSALSHLALHPRGAVADNEPSGTPAAHSAPLFPKTLRRNRGRVARD